MQATLFWACAVAPKRLRRFAHAQNDLIWTAADATELDLATAPNGGSRATIVTRDRHAARLAFQRVSDPYRCRVCAHDEQLSVAVYCAQIVQFGV
jgi:hypothetical protein